MSDEWDRALMAEKRRCDRLGLVFSQPGAGWRQECYRAGDVVELGNANGAIAAYRGGSTGRVTRMRDRGAYRTKAVNP